MRIAIVDDDKQCCETLEKWLKEYSEKEKLDVEVFYDTDSFMKKIEENYIPELLFLDIEFPNDSGIKVAKDIRKKFNDLELGIIFISGHTKYCMDLFDCHPFNFHHKPLEKKKIEADIDTYLERIEHHNKRYVYYEKKVQRGIAIGEIRYFEAKNKTVEISTINNEKIVVKDRLSVIYDKYNEQYLCQCHRSFVINLYYVEKYKNEKFWLDDGTEIPVGRKYLKRAKEMWKSYGEGNY